MATLPRILRLLALASLLNAAPVATPAQETEVHVSRFADQGFSIAAPGAGWKVQPGKQTEFGFQVDVTHAPSGGQVAAFVLCLGVQGETTAARVLAGALTSLGREPQYRAHESLPDRLLDGHDAPGIDIEWDAGPAGSYRIRKRYVVAKQRIYLLQAHAPLQSWDGQERDLESFFSSFRLIERTATENAQLALGELAQRCGSELDWAKDWNVAKARAQTQGRHVLVVINAFPGFDFPDSTRTTTFMDEDVLALVRARLIPLRFEPGLSAPFSKPEVYGLSDSTFGSALLLVDSRGAVLADTSTIEPAAVLPWLRRSLAQHPEPGDVSRPSDALEHAKQSIDRGEFERAQRLLERFGNRGQKPTKARAQRLWARLYRLRREGPRALRALTNAAALAPDQAVVIACERAVVLCREGQPGQARNILRDTLGTEPGTELPRVLYLLSLVEPLLLGASAARPLHERLVAEHPATRWAWLAASAIQLENQFGPLGLPTILQWPRAEVLEILTEPPTEVLPLGSTQRAVRDGLAWLTEHQNKDGSWPSPRDLKHFPGLAPRPFPTTVNALAVRALLQRGAPHRKAAKRGLAFLLAADQRRRAAPAPVFYMDYTAWSCWAQLEMIADALSLRVGDGRKLRAFGERLVNDLVERVRANGGWSYFLSGTVSEGATNESAALEQSISFTTAAIVQSLVRARDAKVPVPGDLIENALDCLAAMRAENGLFAYMLYHPSGFSQHQSAPASAGRGPACELALFVGARSDEERLLNAQKLFDEHCHSLSAELGKALMHAGPDGQGSHYLFYDYLMASRSIAELPKPKTRRARTQLLELVLAARLKDGSFLDTPVNGRVYGTATALLSLHALGQ